MIPSLLILRVGRRRGIYLPLPLFVLWPVVVLTALAVGIARLLRAGRRRGSFLQAAYLVLVAFVHLRGLKVDVRSADGTEVYFSFV